MLTSQRVPMKNIRVLLLFILVKRLPNSAPLRLIRTRTWEILEWDPATHCIFVLMSIANSDFQPVFDCYNSRGQERIIEWFSKTRTLSVICILALIYGPSMTNDAFGKVSHNFQKPSWVSDPLKLLRGVLGPTYNLGSRDSLNRAQTGAMGWW